MCRSLQGSRAEIRLTVYRPLVYLIYRLDEPIFEGFSETFLKSQVAVMPLMFRNRIFRQAFSIPTIFEIQRFVLNLLKIYNFRGQRIDFFESLRNRFREVQ